MRYYLPIGLLVGVLELSGCSSTLQKSTEATATPCGGDGKPEKTVQKQSGIIRYDAIENEYRVVSTVPNTIDSQDVGVVCNLPDKLKSDGLIVVFDGEYRQYDKIPKAMLGGQSFYYLTINKLTSEKGNM